MSPLKVAQSICVAGVILSGLGAIAALVEYRNLALSIEIVEAIRPVERDYVSESVAPLLKDQPESASALKLVQGRLTEVQTVHSGWLNYIESRRLFLQLQLIAWVAAQVAFLTSAFSIGRAAKVKA